MYPNNFDQQQNFQQYYNSQGNVGMPNLFMPDSEKSYIDKTLSLGPAKEIQKLMESKYLDRITVNKIITLLNSPEMKQLNFTQADRFWLGIYYVWIRKIHELFEKFFDYKEKVDSNKVKTTERGLTDLQNIHYGLSHALKSRINAFLYIARSSQSIGSHAFDLHTSQTINQSYTQPMVNYSGENRGIFGHFKGGQPAR